ncbi:hypothetical protein ACFWIA_30060 [Streptomyces sp. NPDC127068]|uniref:alpha/beta hydrolase n=1 Tax=Streptomyces sp. NPDC127068 TaxID=3347127 RepID=UPI0036484353
MSPPPSYAHLFAPSTPGRGPGRRGVLAAGAALGPALLLGAAPTPARAAPGRRRAFTPLLPPPTGRHRVGQVDVHLRDEDRPDPWRPDRARELMVTLTYPTTATTGTRPRWLSRTQATRFARGGITHLGLAEGAVDWAGIRTHTLRGAPVRPTRDGLPIVVLMAGALLDRIETTQYAEELASHGYLVVQPDHTHETPLVEFPDGRTARAVIEDFAQYEDDDLEQMIQARVDDTGTILAALERFHRGRRTDASGRRLPDGLVGALDPSRVGIGGHSAGGFATGEALRANRRIRAGVNLDGMLYHSKNPQNANGWVFGESGLHGLAEHQAFLLVGAEWSGPAEVNRPSPHSHVNDEFLGSWKSFWAAHRGWKRDFTLTGAKHLMFTTAAPVHAQLVKGAGLAPGRLTDLFGTTPPEAATRAPRALLTAFFDLHLRERADPRGLLDGDTHAHPDLVHVP